MLSMTLGYQEEGTVWKWIVDFVALLWPSFHSILCAKKEKKLQDCFQDVSSIDQDSLQLHMGMFIEVATVIYILKCIIVVHLL